MHHIPLDILVNVSFGTFALVGGFLVLHYRKSFTFYNGVAILLFALGISSCTTPFLSRYDSRIIFMLYFFSRATFPIFLFMFSEYILKINYHIIIKLLILTVTWFFVIGSFFQKTTETFYSHASDYFFLAVIVFVAASMAASFISLRERLLKKYIFVFLVTLTFVIVNELLRLVIDNPYTLISIGVSSLLVTHGIILIVTSGGSSRLRQKQPILLYILLFSVILCGLLKFFHSEIEMKYLTTLLVISIGILSTYYLYGEVSKSPKKIGSALLISRLLSLPLHDKDQFLEALRQWEEINELVFVDHNHIEGNGSDLNSLFYEAGRVIHKNQINTLTKALAFNQSFISGIEVAQFYFKKFDCQSLFQISENGDFIAIKYMKGLNPALYANELSLMTKIVFSTSGPKTS